jgi:hypothetical protein
MANHLGIYDMETVVSWKANRIVPMSFGRSVVRTHSPLPIENHQKWWFFVFQISGPHQPVGDPVNSIINKPRNTYSH